MTKICVLVAIGSVSLLACSKDKPASTTTTPTTVATDAPACTDKVPDGATKWMSWEGGVDVMGMTDPGLPGPNVIIHVAKMVKTPAGSAPSGMILYQPDPKGQPVVIGFVSSDPKVGEYFGPNIFAGTPFEKAPVNTGTITVSSTENSATAKTEVGGHVFEVEMTNIAAAGPIDRAAGSPMPFHQLGTEGAPGTVNVKVDGKPLTLTVPPQGIAGGAGATWAPCGVYAR